MTVNGASACMYSVDGLRYVNLKDIAKELAKRNGTADDGPPKIYVDCNNAYFKCNKSVVDVVTVLLNFAAAGFIVVPVYDGTRPIGKQATPKRAAGRELDRIKAFQLRTEIIGLQNDLNTKQFTQAEVAQIEKRIADATRSMKSKETSSRNAISDDFVDELREKLQLTNAHDTSDTGGTVAEVYVAEYQADPVLVQSVLSKECVLVISNDGDIAILAGDDCIEVMNYTKDKKIKIRCTSLETLKKAINCLPTSIRHSKLDAIVKGTGTEITIFIQSSKVWQTSRPGP